VKKAADILARMLDDKNKKIARSYSSVFGGWEQIVGPSLAEHSRIYEIANNSLFVEVDHPGWMQLLMMRKPQILRTIRKKIPSLKIDDIRIKVNLSYPYTFPESEESRPDSKEGEYAVQEDQRQDVDRILSSVSQEELKRRLKKLFLKSLEKDGSGDKL
jgi:hypothetical protein